MIRFETFLLATVGTIWMADLFSWGYTLVLLRTRWLDAGLIVRPARIGLVQDKAKRLQNYHHRKWRSLSNMLLFKPAIAVSGLWLTQSLISLEVPTLGGVLVELLALFVIGDFCFYWVHRGMHVQKWIYKKIHLEHHTANRPNPMDFIYVSPWEIMIENTGTFAAILIIGLVQPVSFATVLTYGLVRGFHAVQVHSGVDFKWMPTFLPGSTDSHDLHHFRYNGNYAFLFKFYDRIFGTLLDAADSPLHSPSARPRSARTRGAVGIGQPPELRLPADRLAEPVLRVDRPAEGLAPGARGDQSA